MHIAARRRRFSDELYVHLYRAMRLPFAGDFDEAQVEGNEAARVGDRIQDPNTGNATLLLSLMYRRERGGFAVDANTLYPLLRRLEKQGLLTSDWNTDESRPRKFYRTSDEGVAVADILGHDWDDLADAFRTLKEES